MRKHYNIPSDIKHLIEKHHNKPNDSDQVIDNLEADILNEPEECSSLPILGRHCMDVDPQYLDRITSDYVVFKILGDGACFYSSCSAHIYKDPVHVDTLRMLTHHFIVENWWYFKDFIPFPFQGTVGVGEQSYSICIEDAPELHSFLLSQESLKLWSESQVFIHSVT